LANAAVAADVEHVVFRGLENVEARTGGTKWAPHFTDKARVEAYIRSLPIRSLYIAAGWLLPGRKRVVPYSIQTLKRLKPEFFRQDVIALFDLLQQKKIKPLIAQRFPLAEARHAQELLGKGGVTGKIVLVRDGSSLESGAAQQQHEADGACRSRILEY
jgi:D-arabinose 1-dehydrogenase-like Zn-dependent alcohol dehydrogenase